jgi:hypothetical protein
MLAFHLLTRPNFFTPVLGHFCVYFFHLRDDLYEDFLLTQLFFAPAKVLLAPALTITQNSPQGTAFVWAQV